MWYRSPSSRTVHCISDYLLSATAQADLSAFGITTSFVRYCRWVKKTPSVKKKTPPFPSNLSKHLGPKPRQRETIAAKPSRASSGRRCSALSARAVVIIKFCSKARCSSRRPESNNKGGKTNKRQDSNKPYRQMQKRYSIYNPTAGRSVGSRSSRLPHPLHPPILGPNFTDSLLLPLAVAAPATT